MRYYHHFVLTLRACVAIAGLIVLPNHLQAESSAAPLSTLPLPLRLFPEDRTNRDNRLALALPAPMKSREMSLAKTLQEVTAFDFQPASTSGFSHVVVPFDTDDRTSNEAASEANAFSLLLHSALRWSDGCYQTIDPLPFCRTNKDLLLLTSRTLNRDGVKRIAKDASATHVITGTLKREDKKYTGEIGIFERNGAAHYKKKYKEPMGFFELLSRMAADAAESFGHPLTQAARDHIQVQRCQYRRSLLELGSLVFEDDRHTELKIFTAILQRDPGFSEARIWAASRGHLIRGDKEGFARHVSQAFNNYMTAEALDLYLTTDPEALRPAFENADTIRLTALLGPEHPFVLTAGLVPPSVPSADAITTATRIAGSHPCDPYLLERLSDRISTPESTIIDHDLAAELLWVSLQCRHDSPGSNGTYRVTRNLSAQLLAIGHADLAARVMDSIFSDVNGKDGYRPTLDDIDLYYRTLRQNRRYEDAFNAAMLGVMQTRDSAPSNCTTFVIQAGYAAALAGDDDMLEQILSKYRPLLSNSLSEVKILGHYAKALRQGPEVDIQPLSDTLTVPVLHEETLLLAQLDLLRKEETHRERLERSLATSPMDRELWSLYDDYDRQNSSSNSLAFYESLNWLCGNDGWVIRAVADFRDRTEKLKFSLIGNDEWDAILAPGSTLPLPPPHALAASIQPLLLKKKFDQAELRIRSYMDRLSTSSDSPTAPHQLRGFCQHLLRLVQSRILFPGT